jgi:flagellar L-ring protein precursor FlgH
MKRLLPWLCSLALAGGAAADSLWQLDSTSSLVADRKAVAIGDILTVLVQESSTASKDNSTKTGKKTAVDASLQTLLFSPTASGLFTHNGKLPAMKFTGSQDFDGGGSIENKEQIVAKIPVRVVDVLPNRHLVVEGTRHTSFSGEKQNIILRGVVRPEDIAANNTVFSYHVADATIQIVNQGTVTDSQRKGWLTRLWEIVTPF